MSDEMGLMVWQDFMFACSTYPAEGDWLESVRQEADDNIRRLRNHPCIVLWCGGNECLDAWYNWGWKGRMEKTDPEGARREAWHATVHGVARSRTQLSDVCTCDGLLVKECV